MKSLATLAVLLPALAVGAPPPELRVSTDGRRLVTGGGEPFAWSGDTAWELFHRLDREEASLYLENRAGKGFSIVQAVVLAEQDGLRTPNAYGEVPLHDLDPRRPNEACFEHVDFVVERAAALGPYVGMLPTWGDKVPSANPGEGPVVFDPRLALVDAPTGRPFRVAMANVIAEEVTASWYDRREGRASRIGRFAARGLRDFEPPSAGPGSDWVLVIDATNAAYPAPGAWGGP